MREKGDSDGLSILLKVTQQRTKSRTQGSRYLAKYPGVVFTVPGYGCALEGRVLKN